MVPLCRDQGVGVLPLQSAGGARPAHRHHAPRGGGGIPRSGNDPAAQKLYSDADFDVVDAPSSRVARDLGRPPAQVALAWLRDRPGVTAPIVGVTTSAQLRDASASDELDLGAEECTRLEAAYVPHAVVGPE
jgi:aryl-alcohol dehydrogenase-like predicted oxidoreductase